MACDNHGKYTWCHKTKLKKTSTHTSNDKRLGLAQTTGLKNVSHTSGEEEGLEKPFFTVEILSIWGVWPTH